MSAIFFFYLPSYQTKVLSPTECNVGKYGFNCKNNCSRNCKTTNPCDKITGKCQYGCQFGWKEPTCETSKKI